MTAQPLVHEVAAHACCWDAAAEQLGRPPAAAWESGSAGFGTRFPTPPLSVLLCPNLLIYKIGNKCSYFTVRCTKD